MFLKTQKKNSHLISVIDQNMLSINCITFLVLHSYLHQENTMAWLLHCCLQKIKTVKIKTVKKPTLITHKDLRLTKIRDFCSREYGIMSKIEPKQTRVGPKKRPIYDVELFSAAICGIGALAIDILYIPHLKGNEYISLLSNIALYSKNHLWLYTIKARIWIS